MTQIQIFVILSGIVLTVLIAWYFWFAPKAQTRVAVSASGAQEVAITVKGGYTPDVIVVQKGRPVRLTFTRQESSACSEKVLFCSGRLDLLEPPDLGALIAKCAATAVPTPASDTSKE